MDDQLYNLIEEGDLIKIQEYYNQKIFNSIDYKYIFFHASIFGHLEILKWISEVYPIILDPVPDPDLKSYFQFACVSENYEKYFAKGQKFLSNSEDYTSHNTKLLNIKGLKKLLMSLDFIKDELNA